MTSNLDEKGLRSIVAEYDLFFIDIWGVLHNGLNIFQNSVEVLEKLEKNKKQYVLLTNAPRPNLTVIEYLKKMGLDEKKAQQVYTSGQAALDQLKTMNSKSFFHILVKIQKMSIYRCEPAYCCPYWVLVSQND